MQITKVILLPSQLNEMRQARYNVKAEDTSKKNVPITIKLEAYNQ